MSAGRDVDANLRRAEVLAGRAEDADLIAFPEVFVVRGTDADYRRAAESPGGPVAERLAALARRCRSWLLAGSLVERCGRRFYNTSVLFDRNGRVRARYRKIHLFEVRIGPGRWIREGNAYDSGRTPVCARIEGWSAGLAICYDVRFPELFRHYSSRGADVLFVPSNFTQNTGRDHWEVLVRARAIENQCYVIAPNQCGGNPATGIASYGHSMAVGPWGEVLCEAGTGEALLQATLLPRDLRTTRRRIPALRHRVL